MATVKNFGIAGVSSDVQWGKGNGRINNDGTDFQIFANPTGSTLGNLDVLTPTEDDHAATKQYVDSVATGLDVKDSVRVATIAASDIEAGFTYSNGADDNTTATPLVWTGAGSAVFDGVTVADTERVLIKDATDQRGNGIFTFDSGAGFRRASDADNTSDNEVSGGMFTFIEEGTQADTGWVLSSPDGVVTLGTDSLVFSQFSGAGSLTGGDGINIAGGIISVDLVAASPLGFTSSELDIIGGTTGNTLVADGSGFFRAGALDLADTDAVTGVLDAVNGGTDQSTVTAGDLLFGSGANTWGKLAVGTDNEVLKLSGTTLGWESQSAADVTFAASGTITSGDVQAAIEELDSTVAAIDTLIDAITSFKFTVPLNANGDTVSGDTIPASATVLRVYVNVGTADGSATLTVGVTGTPAAYAGTTDTDPTVIGLYKIDLFSTTVGALQATVAGTAATGGATADVIVEYKND